MLILLKHIQADEKKVRVAKTAGRKRQYDEIGNPPKLLAHPWINESLSPTELFEKYGNDAAFQQYMFGLYVKDKVCMCM